MIELETRESVTILHMVRGKGNALNLEFVETLSDMLEKLEHSTTRAVVMTGQGGTFCAGDASVFAGASRKGGGSGVNEAASFLAVVCGLKIAMCRCPLMRCSWFPLDSRD